MSIQELINRAVLALGFEERTGLNAFDASLKANNGTLLKSNGVLPAWVAGKDGFGGALDFDGVGAYLEVADNASLTFGDGTSDEPFTVSVWIDADDITSFCPIGKGIYNTDAEWRLLISADDKVYFQTFDESVANCYIGRMYDTVLTGYEGTYIHIVGTYDGSGASTGFKIFVNGVRVDDATYENVAGSYVAMENALNHAVWVARDAANYGNGKVDEVLVLPLELTEAEVRALYESRSAFTATPNLRRGLVLDLDLQEGAGLVAHDRSWYANNGALVGLPTWVEGGGLDFDGIDNKITVADSTSLRWGATTSFSIIFRIKTTTHDADRYLMLKDGVGGYWYLRCSTTGFFTRFYDTVDSFDLGRTANFYDGEWHEVAIVIDRTSNLMTMYFDATTLGTLDITTMGAIEVLDAINIGFKAGYTAFDGIIDKTYIYNRALSPAEIRAIYEGGR